MVARNLPPTLAFTLIEQDRQLFDKQVKYGPQGRSGGNGYSGPGSSDIAKLPNAVSPGVTNRLDQLMNNLTITPRLAAAATTVVGPGVTPTERFTFSQTFTGGSFNFTALSPTFTVANYTASFSSISRSVAYPGAFPFSSFNITGVSASVPFSPSSGTGGTFIVSPTNNSFSVSGPQGGTLTGTGSMLATAALGATTTTLTLAGPVSITNNGTMTFTPTGTFSISGGSPTSGTVTNANLTASRTAP
ncbi:MAG: hypothetical protein NTW80_08930 [Deltaproteobacteria bacterium]|nr:hypothetical protein [Deltaproteobacteria bacterium]